MDEDDIGTYSIKTVDDPQTLNKTLYLRPPENILSQNELIDTWEKLSGKVLEKIHVRNDELLASMEGKVQSSFIRWPCAIFTTFSTRVA